MPPEADKDQLMRRVAAYLAVIVVLGFLGQGVMLTFVVIPTANKETFLQFSGALSIAFGSLMGYLYGRSANGDVKDRALAAAVTAASPPTDSSGVPIVKVDDSKPVSVKEAPELDINLAKLASRRQ